MKLLIIEASYPKDFFSERLDGHVTHHLTKLLRIDSKLVYALDKRHLAKAVTLAAKGGYDVVHLSCHGADDGIAVTDNTDIDWPDFVQLNANRYSPEALVMSSCYGAADGLADEFEKVKSRPKIIFGSTDERDYNEYAVTWTILYNLFRTDGVHRVVAREALRAINAIVHRNFRYLRWDESPSLSAIPGRRPALCNNREGQEEIHEVAITRLRYTHVGDIRRLLAPPGPLLARCCPSQCGRHVRCRRKLTHAPPTALKCRSRGSHRHAGGRRAQAGRISRPAAGLRAPPAAATA